MNQLIAAALTLFCASSISTLSPTPSRGSSIPVLEVTAEVQAAPALAALSSAQPGAPIAAPIAAAETELAPAAAVVLKHFQGRHTRLSRRDLVMLAKTIVEQANRHKLDPSLVLAVINVESGGYNHAVSHVGALGLMQLMPATGQELAHKHGVAWSGEESLFDPIVNVKLGTAYLKQLSDKYDGNVEVALAAYNWGPGRIDRFLRRGSPVPTEYIQRVMRSYSDTRRAAS